MSSVNNFGSNFLFHVPQGKIHFQYSPTLNNHGFYLHSTGNDLTRIKQVSLPVIADFSHKSFSSKEKILKFLEATYPRLILLSNGSWKLDINFRMLGGMLSEGKLSDLKGNDISNLDISNAIKNVIPKESYKSINVQNASYNFSGLGDKPSRIITLQPHEYKIENFLIGVITFFRGYKFTSAMDGTLISAYLLHGGLSKEEEEKAKNEIITSFSEKRSMYIRISNDWKFIEVGFSEAPKDGCLLQ